MLPRAIKLNSKWGKRIIRVWIALILPAAAICGFFALDQHLAPSYLVNRERNVSEAIKLLDAEIIEAKQNNKIQKLSGMKRNSAVITELVERKSDWERAGRRNRDERSNRWRARNRYIALSIVIVIMPAILLVLYRFMMWLWIGREEKA